MGGGLRLYWFQKCSLSVEFDDDEEGVEVPLDSGERDEYIEEGVKDSLEAEEDLEVKKLG